MSARPDRLPAGPVIRSQFSGLAILSMVAGALLLLENHGLVGPVHRLWPVFPGFVGFGLTLVFARRGRRDLVMLGLGSYLLGLAALFLVLNYTRWSLLERAWPVFLALLGVSTLAVAPYAQRARQVFWFTGSFLVLLALVFYLVFGLNPRLWPASLVLFGCWILVLTRARRQARDAFPER